MFVDEHLSLPSFGKALPEVVNAQSAADFDFDGSKEYFAF